MDNVLLHRVPCGEQPMDVDFHPSQPLLATAVIDGRLLLHAISPTVATLQHSIKAHPHDHPCRAVRFSLAGDMVMTASTDKSLLAVDVETGKASARKRDAHNDPISRLTTISETVTASGDDAGVVKLWDSRQSDALAALDLHDDYVADMAWLGSEHALLSVSGDGTLAVVDLRTRSMKAKSEGDADDELLAVVPLKQGKKLVCGTTSGVLNVWSWGYWNDCSDRFPGHPECVNTLVAYDEDTILTGSSDGLIRILSIQPNKMLGVLGEHADFDVEKLAANAELSLLASASHDNTIKVWDLSVLLEEEEEEEEEESWEEEEAAQPEAEPAGAAVGEGEEQQEEEGQAKAEPASEESDSDSDGPKGNSKKRRKQRGAHRIVDKRTHRQSGGNFFSDLL